MSFSKTGWTSIVLCRIFDIGQTRDLPQRSTDGQVHSFSLPNNSPPEIITVGAASWCFAAWTSSGHCFNNDILCLKFEFNTRIQRMRIIFDGMHNFKIPTIHKQPTWMCVCTRSCYTRETMQLSIWTSMQRNQQLFCEELAWNSKNCESNPQ